MDDYDIVEIKCPDCDARAGELYECRTPMLFKQGYCPTCGWHKLTVEPSLPPGYVPDPEDKVCRQDNIKKFLGP